MSAIDDNAFTYEKRKNGAVSISWYGKSVTELKAKAAAKFLYKIETASSEKEEQIIMAKITGHFKRGNEKSNQ